MTVDVFADCAYFLFFVDNKFFHLVFLLNSNYWVHTHSALIFLCEQLRYLTSVIPYLPSVSIVSFLYSFKAKLFELIIFDVAHLKCDLLHKLNIDVPLDIEVNMKGGVKTNGFEVDLIISRRAVNESNKLVLTRFIH